MHSDVSVPRHVVAGARLASRQEVDVQGLVSEPRKVPQHNHQTQKHANKTHSLRCAHLRHANTCSNPYLRAGSGTGIAIHQALVLGVPRVFTIPVRRSE
jgi:hypothetical protein